ncbi:uncharacterized protein N7482_004576 [Penicillium canariense]|uniref:N-acetyltransferase domain-containing protein n=1 Tax=Penicillium canariense TaxID=189055 RepID=A0A9W9IAM2_9EURO|nr:uncharacterized protein N7482_004576 [Penicillium canariense]KAJ5168982.1 hypothetical protein N7482_004576 [Penicillium canariense]
METARLRFEPIDLAYLDGFHRIWSDHQTTQWSSRGVCKTIEETKGRISGILPDANRPGIDNYGVFIRPWTTESTTEMGPEDSQVIGIVGVHKDDPIPELGYIFHPSAWGKGYATEAVSAFVQHYFTIRPDAQLIEAKVDSKNLPSIRVLQKCGFDQMEILVGGAEQPWLDPPVRDLVVFRTTRKPRGD